VGDGQNFVSADLAYALAVRLLDLEDETCNYAVQDMPTFVHMKSYVQNINHTKISGVWKDSIPSQLREDLSIDIGNYRQTLPVHYVEKDWLTKDMVSLYEKKLGL
jgi:enamine deaminase RidA (YjgF/YER057c/UK114 family)